MGLAGRRFPDVMLPDARGAPRKVLGAPGSVSLVGIGHSDCGTTRLVIPYLQRIHDRRGSGSSVLLVLQDDAATAGDLLSEIGVDLPVRLESDPYPVSRELGLDTVPTLLLVGRTGNVERASLGFRRDDIEDLAARLGVPPPFFGPGDTAPALRPG